MAGRWRGLPGQGADPVTRQGDRERASRRGPHGTADRLSASAGGAVKDRGGTGSQRDEKRGRAEHVPEEENDYERSAAAVGVAAAAAGASGCGAGGEAALGFRPRNGLRPKSASFSERIP